MACAVAAPVLEPSGNFPAWLEAQGVNAEVAQAMDSELGIRDYGVLRACVGDGLVRAELLATARDRLPFGFYAVLRQVVKALQGAEIHDGGTPPRWDDVAASSPGDVTLGGLVDVLLALFSGLSRELLLSARKLGATDGQEIGAVVLSPPGAEIEHEDLIGIEGKLATEDDPTVEFVNEHKDLGQEATSDSKEPRDEGGGSSLAQSNLDAIQTWHGVKMEICDDIPWSVPGDNGSHHRAVWEEVTLGETALVNPMERSGNFVGKGHSGIIIKDVTSLFATGKALMHGKRRDIEDAEEAVEDGQQPLWRQQKACGGTTDERVASDFSVHPLVESNHRQAPSDTESGLLLGLVQRGGCFQLSADQQQPQQQQQQVVGSGKSSGAALSCDICGQVFTQRRIMDIHRLTHTGEKPHRCGVCGRAFSQSCSLKRHHRTHTGEKPHRCTVCGRAFALPGDLKNHQRIHTGEKPYRCTVCDRSFSWYSSLKIHQNTHTREWPLRCKVCGLVFGQHANFRRHQRVHARGEEEAPPPPPPPPPQLPQPSQPLAADP